MLKRLFIIKLGLLLSCLLPLPVLAQSTEGINIFGDSLVDNGNAFKATGGLVPPSPPYFNGRFSNGPVWVEGFSTELKLPAGTTNNFAVGGATSGTGNTINVALPGLTTQLNGFYSFHLQSIPTNYLSSGRVPMTISATVLPIQPP